MLDVNRQDDQREGEEMLLAAAVTAASDVEKYRRGS
jgi:hypothetical protein